MKNYWIVYVVRYLFIWVLAFYGIYKIITLFYTILLIAVLYKQYSEKVIIKIF